MMRFFNFFTILLSVTAVACLGPVTPPYARAHISGASEQRERAEESRVPLLKGLLSLNFPVTTGSREAQAYFNQGLVLPYGFDHADAERSFLEAAKQDPDCAMAYWGAAFVLGPNINAAMENSAVARAYEMVRKALSLAEKTSPRERALIEALARRYGPNPVKDRSPLDKAFAEAMRGVYARYPDDPDIAVLTAEALMDLHPWDYWTPQGLPRPWTPEIRIILERVIAGAPNHPHGHHLYIHLMENSPTPEVTVRSADVIGRLAPASGHLVHMAAHAYYAAGLYHDCSLSNERALAVDNTLTSSFGTGGLYRFAYVPHVLHFLLAGYMMEGRSVDAVRTARALAGGIDHKKMREPGFGALQHYYVTPYYTLVRFGLWEEILKESPPPEGLAYPLGMWHYARGIAFTRTGKPGPAEEELRGLLSMSEDRSLENLSIWDITKAKDLLAIASEVLAGELAAAAGKPDAAIDHLTQAVALEDRLPFDEPPPWYFPVRQSLGAVLLDLGRAQEAESVFREDLLRNAENPWSLFGWAESLKRQGKGDLLSDAEKRFRRAWSRSDIPLKRPVF